MIKKTIKPLLFATLLQLFSLGANAQMYSFEDGKVPSFWNVDKGAIKISSEKYKLDKKSLQVDWKSGAIIQNADAESLKKASLSGAGGISLWIYNTKAINEQAIFSFVDKNGAELCQLPFNLNFEGWRCVWAKFGEDMKKERNAIVHTMQLRMPQSPAGGRIYFDYFEFTPTVSWQKMSDAQYKIHRTDFSLIHDFMSYRNTDAPLHNVTVPSTHQKGVETINHKLTDWYLGTQQANENKLVQQRTEAEKDYIQKGLSRAKSISIKYAKDNTPKGTGLFPMYLAKAGDTKVLSFMDINKFTLLPLALDYKKNKNEASLRKARFIYDWFYDQGWADGSGMGTLTFEKLRSAGYFHSFYLLKDQLSPKQLKREQETMKWMTMFGKCYQEPAHTGEVADDLRALALPKLIYALSLTDPKEQHVALKAFSDYMNTSISFGPGLYGTIKPDYSGYHHRGVYNSAYYPHALYAMSLVAYLLNDTPYALSKNSIHNLEQALLTFRFFSANLAVPAGTRGRFPKQEDVLQSILPAFVYVAKTNGEASDELLAAYKRLVNKNEDSITEYIKDVNSTLTYTSSVGEAELMAEALNTAIQEEQAPKGAKFMPYSGLLTVKDKDYQFNIKGFSKYIWDFESSSNENLLGRYTSHGHIEYVGLSNTDKSFNSANAAFDWNHITGTTSILLPEDLLMHTKEGKKVHRSFSDQSFLTGVAVSDKVASFAMQLHDITYEKTFYANKSVFVFDEGLLCIGTGIRNQDREHNTATTLFQSPMGKQQVEIEKIGNNSILKNMTGILYALKDATAQLEQNKAFDIAYINHSKAPQNASYAYYMLPNGTKQDAKKLLSETSPISFVKMDTEAHIVSNSKTGVTYASLFDIAPSYSSLLVNKVNIPLSYIVQQDGDKYARLTLCEPDMRRTSVEMMDMLTEADVIEVEKAHDTKITLNGNYKVACDTKSVDVLYDGKHTIVTIPTIRGENYTLKLEKK